MVGLDTLYEKVKMKFATALQNGTHKERDQGDAPKPPGGALSSKNVGVSLLANYELKRTTVFDGGSLWTAYVPDGIWRICICAYPNKRNFDEKAILLILNEDRAASFIHYG